MVTSERVGHLGWLSLSKPAPRFSGRCRCCLYIGVFESVSVILCVFLYVHFCELGFGVWMCVYFYVCVCLMVHVYLYMYGERVSAEVKWLWLLLIP